MSLAESLLSRARAAGVTIVTAESCTGGMIAAAITDIPGASDILDCGFVTYSNAAKTRMLGVPSALIARHGAVSEEVAAAMAQGARAASGAALALSVTGVAGPGGTAAKPEGLVCFGLSDARGTRTQTIRFGALGRARIRAASTQQGLAMLITALPPYDGA